MRCIFAKALIVLSSLKLFDGELLMNSIDRDQVHDGDVTDVDFTTDYSNDNNISTIVKWYENFHDPYPKHSPADDQLQKDSYGKSSEVDISLYETSEHRSAVEISDCLSVDSRRNSSCIDTSMVDVHLSYAPNNTGITSAGNSSADYDQIDIFTPDSEKQNQLLDTASILKDNEMDENDDDTKYNGINVDGNEHDVNNTTMDEIEAFERLTVEENEVISEIKSVEEVEIPEQENSKEQIDMSENEYNRTSSDNLNSNGSSSHFNSSDDNSTTTPINITSVLSPSLDSRLKRLEDLVGIRRELVNDYNSRSSKDLHIDNETILNQIFNENIDQNCSDKSSCKRYQYPCTPLPKFKLQSIKVEVLKEKISVIIKRVLDFIAIPKNETDIMSNPRYSRLQ